MSNEPLVSICVPSYNHAQYLPETLDSALAQTYPNIEIIIVDDGSTDDSLAIARDYENRHPDKIKVHTHPNGANRGISRTVNLAFSYSKGKYWAGLASDDIFHRDKIEKQVAFLEKNPALGFVYCYVDFIDANGKKIPGRFGTDITQDKDPVKTLIVENCIPGMAILVRREAFARAGDHDPDLVYSDWDFWVRLFSMSKGGFIPEALIDYRVHTYNTSIGKPRLTQISYVRAVYDKLLEHVDNRLLNEPYREIIEKQIKNLPAKEASWLLIDYYDALADGQYKIAFQALKDAFRVSPGFVLNPRRLASLMRKAILSPFTILKVKQN